MILSIICGIVFMMATTVSAKVYESQFHWDHDGVETHIHTEVTGPDPESTVSKPFVLHVKTVLFQYDGVGYKLTLDHGAGGYLWSNLTNESIEGNPNGVATYSANIIVDPAQMTKSGRVNLLIRNNAKFHDGTFQTQASLRIPLYVVNNKPESNTPVNKWRFSNNGLANHLPSNKQFEFRYTNMFATSDLPIGTITQPTVVSFDMQRADSAKQCCGIEDWHALVSYNPNLHAGNMGNVVYDDMNTVFRKNYAVTIDPNDFPPGNHKLMFMATTDDGVNRTQSAIAIVHFKTK